MKSPNEFDVKIPENRRITQRELAKHSDVSLVTVNKLIKNLD